MQLSFVPNYRVIDKVGMPHVMAFVTRRLDAFDTARLDWLTGADNVGRFRLPGTRHEKSFCRTCGSALPTVQDAGAGAVLVVPAGALDGPVDLTPAAKICYADRAGWVDGLDRVPTLDGLPG